MGRARHDACRLERLAEPAAQNGEAQRFDVGLHGAGGFGGERCKETAVGAEIAWLPRQLGSEQAAGLGRHAVAGAELTLDAVAERALERDHSELGAHLGRRGADARGKVVGTGENGGAKAVGAEQRLHLQRGQAIQAERVGEQAAVADRRPVLRSGGEAERRRDLLQAGRRRLEAAAGVGDERLRDEGIGDRGGELADGAR